MAVVELLKLKKPPPNRFLKIIDRSKLPAVLALLGQDTVDVTPLETDDPISFVLTLRSAGYGVAFSAGFIEYAVANARNFQKDSLDDISYPLLHLSLAWLITFQATGSLDYLTSVLDALNMVCCGRLENISVPLFTVIFSDVTKKFPDCALDMVYRPMMSFYRSGSRSSEPVLEWLRELVKRSPPGEFSERASDLISFVTQKLTGNGLFSGDGEALLDVIKDRIANLDVQGLLLAAKLIGFVSRDYGERLARDIPSYLAHFVNQRQDIIDSVDCDVVDQEPVGKIQPFSMIVEGDENHEFDEVNRQELTEPGVPDDVEARLSIIASGFGAFADDMLDGMIIESRRGECSLSLFCILMAFARKLRAGEKSIDFWDAVTSSKLFRPNITLFNNCYKGFRDIFRLRKTACALPCDLTAEKKIRMMWRKCKTCPMLAGELFVYFRGSEIMNAGDVLYVICEFFQTYSLQFIDIVFYVFEFLKECIACTPNAITFFHSEQFLNVYGWLFFRREFMKGSMALLVDSLAKGVIIIKKAVRPGLVTVLSTINQNIDQAGSVDLTVALVKAISGLLLKKPVLACEFKFMVRRVSELVKLSGSKDLLYLSIRFTAIVLTKDGCLSSHKGIALTKALRMVEGANPSDTCFNEVMVLATCDLSRRETDIKNTRLFVVHSRAFTTFVDVFWESERIIQYLEFMYGVCKFSSRNCEVCHAGKLDLRLLQLVNATKTDSDRLRKALSIVTVIASVISSFPVVSEFIGMLCPVENRFVSPIFGPAIYEMRKIVQSRHNTPPAWIRLPGATHIQVDRINGQLLRTGLTIAEWIYVEENAAATNMHMFRLVGESRYEIIILLDDLCVGALVTNSTMSQAEKTGLFMPVKNWILIAATLQVQNDVLSITFFCNDMTRQLRFANWKVKEAPIVECHVGGGGRAGTMLLSRLCICQSPAKLPEISIAGPGVDIDDQSLLSLSIESDKGSLRLHNTVRETSLEFKLVGSTGVGQVLSFADVLVRFVTIDAIIPLFAHISLSPADPVATDESNLQRVLNLFFDVLYLSPVCDPDLDAVQYLLARSPDQLTYECYINVYERFGKIAWKERRDNIFNKLIFNPELWLMPNGSKVNDHTTGILSDWRDVMELSYMTDRVCQLIPRFIDLLWNEKIENDMNAVAARDLTIDFLVRVATNVGFSVYDFEAALKCTLGGSRDVAISMLKLIERFPYADLGTDIKHVRRMVLSLHAVTAVGAEDVILQLIGTVMSLYSNEVLEPRISILVIVETLMYDLSSYKFAADFFNQLIDKAMSNIQLWPLVWMIASTGDSSLCAIVKEKLVPSRDHCTHVPWTIWPCILAMTKESEMLEFMISFMLDSMNSEDWVRAYGILTVVSISTGRGNGPLIREFLLAIGRKYLIDDNHACNYIHMCMHWMFCQLPDTFGIDGHDPPSDAFTAAVVTLIEYEGQTERVFGQNRDEDGRWSDLLLAVQCLNVLMNTDISAFLDVAIFLIKLLIIENCADATSYAAILAEDARVNTTFENVVQLEDIDICKRSVMRQHSKGIYGIRTKIAHAGLCIKTFNANTRRYRSNYVASTATIDRLKKDPPRDILVSLRPRWERLWGRLSYDKGCWHQAGCSGVDEIRWKRDPVLCSHGIPAKMKRNFKFNSHQEASYCRDLGSYAAAKKQIEEDNSVRARRRRESIADVLDVGSIDTDAEVQTGNFTDSTSRIVLENAELYTMDKQKKISRFVVYSSRIELEMKSGKKKIIPANTIQGIFKRMHLQKPYAIEIYAEYGRTYFIVFDGVDTARFLWQICHQRGYTHAHVQTKSWADEFKQKGFTEMWQTRRMSTFKYLLFLNVFSSRSFNNTSIYPIFPWTVCDFSSDRPRFDDPDFYRDLSKPMGAIGESRLELVQNQQHELIDVGCDHLWSSYVVSPLWVYLWLMRMEPFTRLHIDIQGGKFDHATRLFTSVDGAYRMATSRQNDFRELIPEFYFQSEFLMNSNQFDLGKNSYGAVNDVKLPNWAKTPLDFVYLHRKALESDIVSENINEWIDLIWGYKQRGEDAKEALNTYDPTIYETAWSKSHPENAFEKVTIEDTMRCCGQVPPQMFTIPHMRRAPPIVVDVDIDVDIEFWRTDLAYSRVVANGEYYDIISCDVGGYVSRTTVDHANMVAQQRFTPISLAGMTAICEVSHNVIAVGCDGGVRMYDVATGASSDLSCETGRVTCFAAAKLILVSGGSDTIVRCWRIVDTMSYIEQHATSSYRRAIYCVAISSAYHSIIAGSGDGSILIITKETGVVTRIIDLERKARPAKILVTNEWGFIVTYATIISEGVVEHWLFMYSINGDFIRKTRIDEGIVAWTTWSSISGFDYILAVDKAGRLFRFEAYYLDPGTPIDTCHGVSCLFYDAASDISVMVKRSGSVKLKSWKW